MNLDIKPVSNFIWGWSPSFMAEQCYEKQPKVQRPPTSHRNYENQPATVTSGDSRWTKWILGRKEGSGSCLFSFILLLGQFIYRRRERPKMFRVGNLIFDSSRPPHSLWASSVKTQCLLSSPYSHLHTRTLRMTDSAIRDSAESRTVNTGYCRKASWG